MKKKLKGLEKTLPSVTLYESDLEEILQIFSGNTAEFQMTDDEFEYDNIEELRSKRGQKITQLTIASNSPEISFMIGKNGNSYLSHGGSTHSIVPFTQIEEILNRRKRPMMAVFFSPVFVIPLLVIDLLLLIRFKQTVWGNGFLILLIAGVFGLGIPVSMQRTGGFSKILLINPHDEKPFLSRNKDTILVGILVAAVTAFLTWLITYATSK